MDQGSGPVVAIVDSGISIDFASYYQKNIKDYNYFPVSRKRNFANLAEQCAAALEILVRHADFSFGLMTLRYDISLPPEDSDFVSEEDLPARVAELFDADVCATIGSIVDNAYIENAVDIDTEHNGRNNEELQFTNDHARVILRWSFACNAVAPIITTYMDEHDIQSRESMNVIMGVFCALLRCFEPEGGDTDVLAKIRKLVESRVLQTRYSDKVMWSYLRNLAIDPHIFIDKLFRKFIAECLPKIQQGTNIIKFFHSFLKNQVRFQFTAKFPMSYRAIRPDVMDSDGVGAMEHLESELVRKDEAAGVIGELVVSQVLRDTCREMKWEPPSENVRHWCHLAREYGINAWQRGMVTKFFLPRIGRVEHIKTRSLVEYVQMFLLVRHWLHENGFPALYDYMSARVTEGADARKLLARKKFVREFMDSTAYRELLGTCYSTSSQSIIDSGVVLDMISSVHAGNFERLPSETDVATEERPVVNHRVETVAQEVLRFVARITRP